MPKTRQTCTRCSQRRQKCDRKVPCTRCVQNNEGHRCTTKWVDGYNPAVHRKYPRAPRRLSAAASRQSATSSSDTSSSGLPPNNQSHLTGLGILSPIQTPTADQAQTHETSVWPSKLPSISIRSLLVEKDRQPQQGFLCQSSNYLRSRSNLRDGNGADTIASGYSPAARAVEIQHIQSILPAKEKLIHIVEYYEQYMIYWISGLYHGPSFRNRLLEAYCDSHELDLQSLDWRWTALLFSILSSGIIGSSEAQSASWGYTIDDKVRLAREWGAACVSCLNLGGYTSQYHIFSVQAIYIMHAYEHLVGSTTQWVALRSVAMVIAKGLGLHKLGPHPDDDRILDLNAEQNQAFIEREIGRRTWYTLVSQEWLCATSLSTHAMVTQKRNFTTSRPHDLDEETMTPVVDAATATFTSVGSYFFDYASLLLEFHNAMVDAEDQDEPTKYAMVLKFDGEMRSICAETIPKCLSPRIPINPTWPKWVAWARKLHQASVNHKIIMIHENFLSKSFRDVRYTYSRWACATAAKNIINLYNTREPEEPQWWVEQAFVVTAGICLILDLFHRADTDPEAHEYQACVKKAINFLQLFQTSSVALHGVRVLMSLLQEYAKLQEGSRANPAARSHGCLSAAIPDTSVPDAASATQTLPLEPEVTLPNDEAAAFNFDIDALGFEDIMDYLPSEGMLNNAQLLFYDSMYSAGNVQSNW